MVPVKRGTYRFGEFELNLDLRVLARAGQRVSLPPKSYELFACLVEHAGTSVSKADLLKTVWPDAYVESGTLTQHIFSLRKALGDEANLIVTVPGHGYRFGAIAQRAEPEPAHAAAPEPGPVLLKSFRERAHLVIEEPMPQVSGAGKPRLSRYAAAAVAAVVLAAAIAGGLLWSKGLFRRAPPRDHVSLVLAEFNNTTGDAVFDRTLPRALAIDLEQSPYLDMIGDKEESATLGMMGRPNDTPLTPAVAREVCVRTNRNVLLAGSISSVGGQYLVILEATDCNTGRHLASAKEEVTSKAGVLRSLDTVAEKLRSRLGESADQIQAYDVPISQATTSSLEALKAYSTVTYLAAHGHGLTDQERLPHYKRAVELDPQFALAYVGIANCYYQLLEPNTASAYLQKAFDLRNRVTAKERLSIEAHYYSGDLSADMLKSLETYRVWSQMYPREYTPWTNMTNIYNELGWYPDAIMTGQKAWQIDPIPMNAALLIRAYKNQGRFAEAKALGELRLQDAKDPRGSNDSIMAIAFYEHDQAAFAREVQLGKENKNDLWNYHQAIPASMEGRYKEAEEFFAAEVREDELGNLSEVKDGVLADEAEVERSYGLPPQARATLARMTRGALDMPDVAFEHAQEGDVAWAERYLARHGNDPHPLGSYLGFLWFPLIHAELALRRGQLAEALQALDASRVNEMKGPLLRMQRAKVLMAMHQPEKAAEIYRNMLATPGSIFGVSYPMAHLWLARAYAAEGDMPGSRAEYKSFLAAWQDGDRDLPVLKAARAELARLP